MTTNLDNLTNRNLLRETTRELPTPNRPDFGNTVMEDVNEDDTFSSYALEIISKSHQGGVPLLKKRYRAIEQSSSTPPAKIKKLTNMKESREKFALAAIHERKVGGSQGSVSVTWKTDSSDKIQNLATRQGLYTISENITKIIFAQDKIEEFLIARYNKEVMFKAKTKKKKKSMQIRDASVSDTKVKNLLDPCQLKGRNFTIMRIVLKENTEEKTQFVFAICGVSELPPPKPKDETTKDSMQWKQISASHLNKVEVRKRWIEYFDWISNQISYESIPIIFAGNADLTKVLTATQVFTYSSKTYKEVEEKVKKQISMNCSEPDLVGYICDLTKSEEDLKVIEVMSNVNFMISPSPKQKKQYKINGSDLDQQINTSFNLAINKTMPYEFFEVGMCEGCKIRKDAYKQLPKIVQNTQLQRKINGPTDEGRIKTPDKERVREYLVTTKDFIALSPEINPGSPETMEWSL